MANADTPVAMKVENGKVLMMLYVDERAMVVPFEAEPARLLAERLAMCAYEAHYGRPAPDMTSALQQGLRMKATDEYRALHLPMAIKVAQTIAPQAGGDAAKIAVAIMDMVLGDRE